MKISQKFDEVVNGTLITWKTDKIDFEFKEDVTIPSTQGTQGSVQKGGLTNSPTRSPRGIKLFIMGSPILCSTLS